MTYQVSVLKGVLLKQSKISRFLISTPHWIHHKVALTLSDYPNAVIGAIQLEKLSWGEAPLGPIPRLHLLAARVKRRFPAGLTQRLRPCVLYVFLELYEIDSIYNFLNLFILNNNNNHELIIYKGYNIKITASNKTHIPAAGIKGKQDDGWRPGLRSYWKWVQLTESCPRLSAWSLLKTANRLQLQQPDYHKVFDLLNTLVIRCAE